MHRYSYSLHKELKIKSIWLLVLVLSDCNAMIKTCNYILAEILHVRMYVGSARREFHNFEELLQVCIL